MRRSDGAQPAFGDDRDAGRDKQRMVGIVGREHDAVAFPGKFADAGQHHRLIAEIEARRGLVHDQDRGLLGERPRDQRKLALAA